MTNTMTLEEEKMSEAFTKFHIKGLPFDAVLHRFTGVDNEDPHDHPFGFTSFVIKGWYTERVYDTDGNWKYIHRKAGDSFRVEASTIHHIVEVSEGGCWTIVLPEKHERKSGFYRFGDETMHRFWDETEFKPLKQMP
jgi:hypothetical protein